MKDFLITHILDILALIIVLWGVYYGGKKGFMRIFITIIGFAAAMAAATFVSSVASDYVYSRIVRPRVIAAVEAKADELRAEYDPSERIKGLLSEQDINISDEQLKKLLGVITPDEYEKTDTSLLTNEKFRATLNSVFTEYCSKLTESLRGVLPEEITESADAYLNDNSAAETDKTKILDDNPLPFAELIEKKIIYPVLIKFVNRVLFLLTFSVVMTCAAILSKIFGILRKADGMVKSTDSFLGILLGFVYSLAILAVFSVLCSIFISYTAGANPLINNSSVTDSYFFKYIYSGTFVIITLITAKL